MLGGVQKRIGMALRTWYSGHDDDKLMVGPEDLSGLFLA